MSLLPEHQSLIELARELRALGVTSFSSDGVSVQFGPALAAVPQPKPVNISPRSARKLTPEEREAQINEARERELSRV